MLFRLEIALTAYYYIRCSSYISQWGGGALSCSHMLQGTGANCKKKEKDPNHTRRSRSYLQHAWLYQISKKSYMYVAYSDSIFEELCIASLRIRWLVTVGLIPRLAYSRQLFFALTLISGCDFNNAFVSLYVCVRVCHFPFYAL